MHKKLKKARTPTDQNPTSFWIYGIHAVLAALANPKRFIHRVYLANHNDIKLRPQVEQLIHNHHPKTQLKAVEAKILQQYLPGDAVHQGIIALVNILPRLSIENFCQTTSNQSSSVVIVLDQITDPHNVGAIIRTACVFGVDGLIIPAYNQAPLEGVTAKAASGGLEKLPIIIANNLSRSLDILKKQGFWCLGLDEAGTIDFDTWIARSLGTGDKIALIVGSEGKGLRQLTKKNCDLLVKLPHYGPMSTLNVSNAVAVSLTMLCPALKEKRNTQ